jgi:hypothetical protein
MRAAVAEPDDRERVLEHRVDRVEVAARVVEEREVEEAPPLVLEHEVVRDRLGRTALARGDGADAPFGARLVVRRIAEREELVPGAQQVGEERVRRLDLLGEDRRAHLGIAEARDALRERQVRQGVHAGMQRERMERALQTHQHRRRACGDLWGEASTAGRDAVGSGQEPAPLRRIAVVLETRERHRPPGLARQALHPVELGILGHQVRRDLEHAAAELAEDAPDADHLVGGGERAGHALAVDGAVEERPRAREAERARGDAVADDRGHRGDVVGRRGLVPRAALAHHVRADGAVRDLRADVEHAWQALDRVEVLGKALPVPLDAFGERGPGMSSTPS